jgi:hypothetical protein
MSFPTRMSHMKIVKYETRTVSATRVSYMAYTTHEIILDPKLFSLLYYFTNFFLTMLKKKKKIIFSKKIPIITR